MRSGSGVDKLLVSAKLESLRRALARVRQRTPANAAGLAADIDAQDIVSLNLQRAVQISVDIAYHLAADTDSAEPATMADAFAVLRDAGVIDHAIAEAMRRAVGFRNIAVHQYEKMDWQIVFDVATKRIEDLEAFARAVSNRL